MTKKTDPGRISDDLIDQLLAGYEKPEDLTGETGILKQLTARLIERAMEAEMTEHLGYEKHAPEGRGLANSRNGVRAKTLKTETRNVYCSELFGALFQFYDSWPHVGAGGPVTPTWLGEVFLQAHCTACPEYP